jgi:hypothetical protein
MAKRQHLEPPGGKFGLLSCLQAVLNSGQIVVAVKAQAGAKSYFIRYAVMNGTTPGAWTTIAAASIQKPITISGLTPTTIYGFQAQALGVLGYSDWSAITTIICI